MMTLIKPFEHLRIPLKDIKSATNNFAEDNCIGRGGFGKVYKGELVFSMEQTFVAVKRLDPAFGQGNPEFWKEIMMLSLYRHRNIVSLLGFCDEGGEKILVYEYVPKRSLDLYLNDNDLTWIRRLRICIGAARGLAYLHSPIGNQQRVLHRDIKSSNILLDENWNARISDFGLSKFGPADQKYTFLVSNAVGTIGYCDPQYVETGFLTKESDVYSFGVVLFEVLCGRLCIDNKGKCPPLTGLVRRYYEENKMEEIIYDNIKDEINPRSLEEFTTIAYQCLKRDLKERPLMIEVVRRLETAIEYQGGEQNVEEFVAYVSVDIIEADMKGLVNPYVKGQLGPYMFRSKTQKKTSSPRWLEKFKIPITSWDSPNDLLIEVWAKNLFIDNILGDCSIKINDLRNGHGHDMWCPLQNINTRGLHLVITIIEVDVQPNMLAVDVDKSVSPPPESSLSDDVDQEPVAFITVEIIEASDMNGLPDPYVRGQLGAYRFRTKTQKKTSSPRWFEEFRIPITTMESLNYLMIEVFDKNLFNIDDILGDCSIKINDISDGQRHDMWLPLQNIKSGRLHLAITVLSLC